MNSERITEAGSPEEIFLARLADVAPVAEATEQVHLTAALAAVREAEVAAAGRRTALRPTVPLWRKPRMALSNVAAIIAGLSLPLKAAAASTVAVAAIGGAAVTGNLPTQADAANEGLSNATVQSGVEQLPADGQPDSRPVGEGGDIEALEVEGEEQENNGVDGPETAAEAQTKEDGRAFGEATASEASDGKSAEARERAAEARANAEQAEARQQEAEARQAEARQREIDAREREEAQQREAEAQARADAEARRQQARDNAATSGGAEAEGEVEGEEQSSTGTDRSGAGRANADGAGAR